MLVLSRRVNEKIVFPGFQATVQVLGIKGNAVRLGIQAPPEVIILRAEIPDRQAEWGAAAATPIPPAPETRAEQGHLGQLVGNRLKIAGLGLELLRGQVEAGRVEDALAIVEGLAQELNLLQRRLIREAEKAAAPPAPARRVRRALLVEDNANERELLARFLRQGGFEVDTASDGADALDYLHARGKPDVLLLDMGMPRCDGPTTVREIRRDQGLAGLKIVAVSGHTQEEYDLSCGPDGIDHWVCKPVDPAALIRDLERELDCDMAL